MAVSAVGTVDSRSGDFDFRGCPTTFWDVYGEQGHPIRATISEMGPLLLAQLMDKPALDDAFSTYVVDAFLRAHAL